MKSLLQCRELLGSEANNLTDDEIIEIRDNLYLIAEPIVTTYQQCSKPFDFEKFIPYLPRESVLNVEERAAIHEFEGDLKRVDAEKKALNDFWKEGLQ